MHGTVGSVDLTSVTGYSTYDYSTSNDYTYLYGPSANKVFGVNGAPIFASGDQNKFSQEFRALVPLGSNIEWLIGAFYTHEHTPLLETIAAENTTSGALLGNLISLNIPLQYNEYAAFTDVTIHFTDRFSIQFGGRESHLEENAEPAVESGALLAHPVTLAGIYSTPNVFTYLVTPQFKLSPDLMLYARAASGYRPGRANTFNPDPSIPSTSTPDKTQNFEIGAKGNVLEHLLSFDASLYYIDFKNIQISLLDPSDALSYYANGSNAKSEGAELSLEAHPLRGLKIAAWGSYDDAVLTRGFPSNTAAYGPTGSRLPYGARVSGHLSVDQEFPLLGTRCTDLAGATESYVGNRFGDFRDDLRPSILRAIRQARRAGRLEGRHLDLKPLREQRRRQAWPHWRRTGQLSSLRVSVYSTPHCRGVH